MSKQELIVPARTTPTLRVDPASVVAPRMQNPGVIGSTITQWVAGKETKAFRAVKDRTEAETELLDAQTKLLEAYDRRQRVAARLQELPELLQSEWATRRAERAERLRQAQHKLELGELERMTQIAIAEAALVDAKQALAAQNSHGHVTYQLAWRKKQAEMLDIELDAAERRAILREHVKEHGARSIASDFAPLPPDQNIDDALHERRNELRARGLDTARIDAVIERRKQGVFI